MPLRAHSIYLNGRLAINKYYYNMYRDIADIFGQYWRAYGKLKALVCSFYLHIAVLLLALTANTWITPLCATGASCTAWWDQSLSVLPNILGFTLGGFAIFIGFGDEKFRALLAEPEPQPEPTTKIELQTVYVELCATFVHFILIQIIALIVAVIAKAWWFYAAWMDPVREYLPWLNGIGGALGYGLFLYALMSVIAATMHVFRIAGLYAMHQKVLVKGK